MIIDFSVLEIGTSYSGTVTFQSETAGFRNAFGMYKIGDDGRIGDVTVIFANSSAIGSGGDLVPGETTFDVRLDADDRIGFFVAPNAGQYDSAGLLVDGGTDYLMRTADGTPASITDAGPVRLVQVAGDGTETEVQALYDNRTWHSTAETGNGFALNGDGTDHTIWDLQVEEGRLVLDMRFEDLWGGGDKDYADIVFRLDVGADNTLAAVDSAKDPDRALTLSDRVVVPQGETVTFDPLANDPGTGLTITHLDGQAVKPGASITLPGGEIVKLLGNGQLKISDGGAPAPFDTLLRYAVTDRSGATDTAVIAIVTPAFARDDSVMVTARGQTRLNLLENDDAGDGALSVTHIDGQQVHTGMALTLASGTRAIYRGDGTLDLTGADRTTDALDRVAYTVRDATGLSDSAEIRITTSPVDGTEGDDTFSQSGQGDAQGNTVGGSDGAAEVIMGHGGNDRIFAGDGDDALHGGAGNDLLRGQAGDDLLTGGTGDDSLDGGAGADIMQGGAGNDAYWVDNVGDRVIEAAGEGIDKVRSTIDWVLGDHVENLYLEPARLGGGAIHGTGNALDNFIEGNGRANLLSGLGGDDRISARDGDDHVDGGAGDDTINGGDGNDTLIGGAGNDKL